MIKRCANCSKVQVITVGMKIACLESQSTTMRTESEDAEVGSGSMKPMEMESHGCRGMGSCCKVP